MRVRRMRTAATLLLAGGLILVACGLGDERDLYFQQGRASLDVNGVSATYTGVTGSNHVLYRPTRPGALPPALIVALGDLRSEFFGMTLDELRGPGRYVPSELTLVLRGVRYICFNCEPCSVQISEASERAVAGDIACAASADGVRWVMVRGTFRLEEPTRQPMPTPVPGAR